MVTAGPCSNQENVKKNKPILGETDAQCMRKQVWFIRWPELTGLQ